MGLIRQIWPQFDFTIDLTPDDDRPNPMDPALLISAMREQLSNSSMNMNSEMARQFTLETEQQPGRSLNRSKSGWSG